MEEHKKTTQDPIQEATQGPIDTTDEHSVETSAQDSDAQTEQVNEQQVDSELDGSSLTIDELQQQLDAMKTQVLRERADNDNLRKRQARELQNAYKFATEKLIKDLLPVLDSLTLGLESAQNNAQSESLTQFISGSEMTLKLFTDTLSRHGVIEINPEGEKFDPERHEAISMTPNPDMEPNTVMHVAQKGYELNGRVIRAAQVVVSQTPQ